MASLAAECWSVAAHSWSIVLVLGVGVGPHASAPKHCLRARGMQPSPSPTSLRQLQAPYRVHLADVCCVLAVCAVPLSTLRAQQSTGHTCCNTSRTLNPVLWLDSGVQGPPCVRRLLHPPNALSQQRQALHPSLIPLPWTSLRQGQTL